MSIRIDKRVKLYPNSIKKERTYRKSISFDEFNLFQFCPARSHYLKGNSDLYNPYEIYCKFITERIFQTEDKISPLDVFVDNCNLFESFSINDKFYDKGWLLSKGLERYEKLLNRIDISELFKVGSSQFQNKFHSIIVKSKIEGIGITADKLVKGITFSPFNNDHTISWSPLHRYQWEELRKLTVKVIENRKVTNPPKLYCFYTDENMLWKYTLIEKNLINEERLRQHQQIVAEIDRQMTMGYIAPALHCPDNTCKFYSKCFPEKRLLIENEKEE